MSQNKYKILFTIPNFDTAGSGKALLKIALGLDKNIFEPHIACLHNRGEYFKVVEQSGIPIHIFESTHSMSNRFLGALKSYKKRFFFKSYDLVHSFHYSDDYSEALGSRMAGTPWIYVKKNMNWNSNAWQLRTKLANGILAQNTDMMKLFFNGSNKTMLVPRGVDTSEFKPRPKSQNLLEEFGLQSETQIILLVANLVPVKGVEYLIDGFKKTILKFNDAVLMIVGDDQSAYAAQLKESCKEETNNKKIIFTGKRSDVKDFQSIATVFILPTLNKGRQEGSPVSLLEAMASGTYVLASDVAGIRDQLSEFPNQLFAPGDAIQISEKLNQTLAMNLLDLKKYSDLQLRVVNQKYTIEKEIENHETFYKRILRIK